MSAMRALPPLQWATHFPDGSDATPGHMFSNDNRTITQQGAFCVMGNTWLSRGKHTVTLQVTVVGCFSIGVVNRTFASTTGCGCSQYLGAFSVNASNNYVCTPASNAAATSGLPNWTSGTHTLVLEIDMAAQTVHFCVDGGNREIIRGIGPEVTIVKFGHHASAVATFTAYSNDLMTNTANPDGVVVCSVRAMVLDGIAACDGANAALAACPLAGGDSGANLGGAGGGAPAPAPADSSDAEKAARLRSAQKRLEGLEALHDVSFRCGTPGEPAFGVVRASKTLLSFRSPVFRTLFFGNNNRTLKKDSASGGSGSSGAGGGGGGGGGGLKEPARATDADVENGELMCTRCAGSPPRWWQRRRRRKEVVCSCRARLLTCLLSVPLDVP